MTTNARLASATPPARFNVEAIKGRIPHRYPFLMIDRVIEASPNRAVALKNVTVNEPCFQGHFPGRAMVPAVLMAECVLQTSAFLFDPDDPASVSQPSASFLACVGINLRFLHSVYPGDRMIITVKRVRSIGPITRIKGSIRVDGLEVVTGECTLALPQ